MVQCAELGDISGPLHSGGGERRHAYCLPFRNHHFSRIDSTSHSMAGRVHCLYGGVGGGGCRWGLCVDSCTKASPSSTCSQGEWSHAASDTRLLTWSEMQFLRRTSGWMLSSSDGCSCRQHTDEATELVQPSGTSCSQFFFLPLSWLTNLHWDE